MQGGQPAYVGSQSSPSTPSPSALCFTSSPKIADNKKHHRHHFHEPYHVGLCGCHRMSKSNCVTAIGEYESKLFRIVSHFSPSIRTISCSSTIPACRSNFSSRRRIERPWISATWTTMFERTFQFHYFPDWQRDKILFITCGNALTTELNNSWFVSPIRLLRTDHFSRQTKMRNTSTCIRRCGEQGTLARARTCSHTQKFIYQLSETGCRHHCRCLFFNGQTNQLFYSIFKATNFFVLLFLHLKSNQCDRQLLLRANSYIQFARNIQTYGKSLSCVSWKRK